MTYWGWGPWTTGVEYWGVSDWVTRARWQYTGAQTSPGAMSDAVAAAEWDKAVSTNGTLSTVGYAPFLVVTQLFGGNSGPWSYQGAGYQFAFGFTAMQALISLPELTNPPPGATTTYEYEGAVGEYLGEARLDVVTWELDNSAPGVEVQMHVRALDVPSSALTTPRTFDGSGATLLTDGPATVDVTAHVADDGDFVITSAPYVVSWTPPTIAEPYRGVEGEFVAEMEYRCRTPRVRWYYEPVMTGEGGDVRRAFS